MMRALFFSRGLSEFGNAFRYPAIALAIFGVNNSAQDAIAGEIAETLGFFLASLIVPSFIDLFSKYTTLLWLEVLSLVVSGMFSYGTIYSSLTVLYAAAGVICAISVYHSSAIQALTATSQGAGFRNMFKGLNNLSIAILVGSTIGALIAGASIAKLGLVAFFVVDGITFLAAGIILLTRYKAEDFEYHTPDSPSLLLQWKEGFIASFSKKEIALPILAQALLGIVHGFQQALILPLMKITIGASDSLVAIRGASNKLLSLAVSVWINVKSLSLRRMLFLGSAFLLIATLWLANVKTALVLIPIALMSGGMSFLAPSNNSFISFQVSSKTLGRVQTFRSLMINLGVLIGQIACYFFVEDFGITGGYYIAAAFVVVSLLFYFPIRKAVQSVELS